MKNKVRIGIDFDNTIICYDNLFSEAVKEKKWDEYVDFCDSKASIKEKLIQLDGNDFRWQELQAIVYGVLIEEAEPFPGVIETLEYFKNNTDIELFVVSHKTKNSHYLKHITLIDKALAWIKDQNLFNYIPEKNFFFLPTRDEKIKVITDLKLDFFIDDLLEVLEDKNFPPIHKLFFSPDGTDLNSWEKIKEHFKIINEIGFSNLETVGKFAQVPFSQMETIKRDGNNKIIRFTDSSQQCFIIKKYSPLADSFSTLETEFGALELLKRNQFPVPRPIFKNANDGLAIYENISPSKTSGNNEIIVNNFSQFLSKLVTLSNQLSSSDFAPARDSRTKIEDYKLHVLRRLGKIEAGCTADERFLPIQKYLNDTFKPLYKIISEKYYRRLELFNLDETKLITDAQKVLSPSDFGMHNAIFSNNKFIFIDFEYFGWDDPVKLIADFLHHAGQDITQETRFEILKRFWEQTPLESEFFMRLSTVLDLVGLEWILIILNIANPEVLKRRLYANSQLNFSELLEQRLQKAQERADLFHTNIESNSVFLSLKSIHSKVMEIPAWKKLIT